MRRIAIVDDNPGDVLLVQETLRERAIAACLTVFADGEDFIRQADLAGDPPHLILMDLRMNRVDGWNVISWIRQQPQGRAVPIVVLSSSMSIQDSVRAMEAGANLVVTKPTSLSEFMGVVGDLVQTWAIAAGAQHAG